MLFLPFDVRPGGGAARGHPARGGNGCLELGLFREQQLGDLQSRNTCMHTNACIRIQYMCTYTDAYAHAGGTYPRTKAHTNRHGKEPEEGEKT